MIPRLFENTATTFNNFGICSLVDAIECTVTEERNGAYYLELIYPRDGAWAEKLTVSRIILAQPYDNAPEAEPFRIVSIEYDMNEDITVQAEHISYQLNNIIIGANQQDPGTRYPAKFWEVENRYLLSASNPFTFNTDINDDQGDVYAYGTGKAVGLKTLLGGMEGSMLDLYGGEFLWNRYTVNLLRSRGADNGVKIAYTKNLTGLNYAVDTSEAVSGAVSIYASGSNYVQGALRTISSPLGYNKDVVIDATGDYSTTPTAAQLNAKSDAYLRNHSDFSVSVDVEFVPLWQTEEYKDFWALEHVGLCDTVTILYSPLNLEIKSKVVKTVYNVLADKYKNITIASIRQDLADTIVGLMKAEGMTA